MIQRDVGAVTSYAEAVAGGYTGTRAQWRQLLANLPNEPFVARYGVTSYTDIKTAILNGDSIVLNVGGATFAFLVNATAIGNVETLYFSCFDAAYDSLRVYTVTSQDVWGNRQIPIVESADIPTKVSQLTNDLGYVTASSAPVRSVNGKDGEVVLTDLNIESQVAGGRTVHDVLDYLNDQVDGVEALLEAL